MSPDLLTPLAPPQPLADVLKQWGPWGAVVDHFLFPVLGEVTVQSHYQAARSGIVAATNLMRDGKIQWDNLVLENGEELSVQEFFGWQFDVQTLKLYLRGETGKHLNDYFAPGDPENSSTALWNSQVPSYEKADSRHGYSYALLDPPYGLGISSFFSSKRLGNSKRIEAFKCLCDELWGDVKTLQIYEWTTACSNYFDAGDEWWGSYFWTVFSPTHNWIVAVLASASD